jgi:DNA-binding transcriptional MerR regulator
MRLLSIGEFAHASRLSPKALRLYDELGLLVPARVDPHSGYRRYAAEQLEPARRVAALRRIGVPLAGIKRMLPLAPADAAAALAEFWSGAEAEHAARRSMAALLADELQGRRSHMCEVEVRDVPERKLLCVVSRMHQAELVERSRELFIRPIQAAALPQVPGDAGAAFMIFHGEVSGDSDGPVEWCKPVPQDRAEECAALLPQLTLRTEPAHQEAYVRLAAADMADGGTEAELALRDLRDWATRERREPGGAIRMVLSRTLADGADAQQQRQFAVPLR